MQGDGNLVVYRRGKAIWSSRTNHHAGAILDMQDDGNLVIYWKGRALWASKDAPAASQGKAIVRAAASQAGVPYCLGGGNQFGPSSCGFDCTGLTMYAVYKATGKVLTHDGRQGTEGGKVIRSKSELRPGDLVFFGGSFGNFLHSGVYAGNGAFWDASNWGVPVQKHSMAWVEHGLPFVGGARYWH
jgi:cell wall-associated NlpC family hydrolase